MEKATTVLNDIIAGNLKPVEDETKIKGLIKVFGEDYLTMAESVDRVLNAFGYKLIATKEEN